MYKYKHIQTDLWSGGVYSCQKSELLASHYFGYVSSNKEHVSSNIYLFIYFYLQVYTNVSLKGK